MTVSPPPGYVIGKTGVAWNRDASRHAGDDFEMDALLVEKQRFGSAAVEDERIAPLQTRDRLAFARLLREQITDRFLIERLRRRHAHVDLLGVGARVAQHSRVHEVVVQHHIRRCQALLPAQGDDPGSPGPAPIK